MNQFLLATTLVFAVACHQGNETKPEAKVSKEPRNMRVFSKEISDSFSISVNLPNDYNDNKKIQYPVVYILDANLYFDIVASVLTKYSDVGLAPSVILVGIGYKDFPAMDSLRTRDYTYPLAIPEYEMSVSGGADKFLSFISNELIPLIDKKYKTDSSKRIVMGHSLGGYFTTYAFLQELINKNSGFSGFIAASPSLHYNRYWLLNQLKETKARENGQKNISCYITYGGMEEAEAKRDTTMIALSDLIPKLSQIISDKSSGSIRYKSSVFSELGHMDTQLPTFIKGLQWMLNENDK
jgi:predicted alpha/beta superfamily hydrolase